MNGFYSLRKREVKLKCTRKGVLYEMKWMEELNNLWVNRSKRKCKLLLHKRDSYKLISTLRRVYLFHCMNVYCGISFDRFYGI